MNIIIDLCGEDTRNLTNHEDAHSPLYKDHQRSPLILQKQHDQLHVGNDRSPPTMLLEAFGMRLPIVHSLVEPAVMPSQSSIWNRK